jgi:hypothetical protein
VGATRALGFGTRPQNVDILILVLLSGKAVLFGMLIMTTARYSTAAATHMS